MGVEQGRQTTTVADEDTALADSMEILAWEHYQLVDPQGAAQYAGDIHAIPLDGDIGDIQRRELALQRSLAEKIHVLQNKGLIPNFWELRDTALKLLGRDPLPYPTE